jgi:DNA-binding IclR family transcriptional regulator
MMEGEVESVGVRSVATSLGMPASSAHRTISALVEEGFLQKDAASGKYALSLDVLRLAHNVVELWPIRRIALQAMRRHLKPCNEAAFLTLYNADRQQVISVASVESTHALRYTVELNVWKAIYVGAAGLAIMAHLPLPERQSIIENTKLAPLTDKSITDPVVLDETLAKIRQRGYAISRGQRIPGGLGLAAPIFGPSGAVFAAVGLSIPENRFDDSKERWLAGLVIACTRDITREIGGSVAKFDEKEEERETRTRETDHDEQPV